MLREVNCYILASVKCETGVTRLVSLLKLQQNTNTSVWKHPEHHMLNYLTVLKQPATDFTLHPRGLIVICLFLCPGTRSASSPSPSAAARAHTEGPSDLLLETPYYNFYQPSRYPTYYGNLYNYPQYQVSHSSDSQCDQELMKAWALVLLVGYVDLTGILNSWLSSAGQICPCASSYNS